VATTRAPNHDRRDEGAQNQEHIDPKQKPDPPYRYESVRRELTEPLLIDPGAPSRQGREYVVVWQALMRDQTPADQREPTVCGERFGNEDREQSSQDGAAQDRQGLARDDIDRNRTPTPRRSGYHPKFLLAMCAPAVSRPRRRWRTRATT
jgi:hypothetical protein